MDIGSVVAEAGMAEEATSYCRKPFALVDLTLKTYTSFHCFRLVSIGQSEGSGRDAILSQDMERINQQDN